jgi:ribosomal protein S15P/S13E
MAVTKDVKQQIVKDFGAKAGDTGTTWVQIAILTA